ncbi:LysM peptidoglycan-binding domain-containing protein [Methylovirgula sp. 4M-Z18]|uniref:LysM peptidoglycan-binding domain-containing protein n=1 Tax=Methylovirgula sp. 4M-Z18 TaxID=2293567 RepID=UPI000E2F008A|nr:LysM peptidoglycan-binding domain-containing protein [Methylovirgula sp. 4M-Z18]RFB80022.1 LysM peptidoglycan-binding domain-containing protein [Methylovirgula sp. 4M-Z18]
MPLQISSFAQVITAKPGDNLFALAALYLGDATQWNRIAEANLAALNGIADPFLPAGAFVTLLMPPVRRNAGGGIFGGA